MTLSETWFLEGYIDFELQKYRLLAYLKDVKYGFDQTRLYPYLADVVSHYNNLLSFRKNKQLLQSQFPKRLDRIDLARLEMVYERMLADDDIMQELERIADYALEEMKQTIDNGVDIYEHIEHQMRIEPVGIMPLYNSEGYVFIKLANFSEVRIYNYTITLFEHKDARYRGIKLDYMDSRIKNLANTYEQIKLDIIRNFRTLPNPAVFKIEYPGVVPLEETLLPVTKRLLVKRIAEA